MAHGGDAARPPAVEPVPELGMASAAQGLGEVRFGAGAFGFDSRLGVAAVRHDVFRGIHLGATYRDSGEFALQVRPGDGRGEVRVGVLRGDPVAVYVNLGEFASQASQGGGRGDPGLVRKNSDTLGHQLDGQIPDGVGAVSVGPRESAQQPRPGAGRGDELAVGAFRGDLGLLYGDAGTFARQLRPIAGRDGELHVLLPDCVGAAYDNNSGKLARQPGPAAGLADGMVAALRVRTGTLGERLRRLLLVVAMVISSAAVTGLAADRASPAAGFGFFALLLGSLSLVMIHVLRA